MPSASSGRGRQPALAQRRHQVVDVPLGQLLYLDAVLMHTWDLARAVGADDRLDPGWCAVFFDQLPADPNALTASGMFVAPVAVDDQADTESKLLARLGRDPSWRPQE
jgi:hypothetical protein